MVLNTVSKAVTAATSPSISYLGAQLGPFLRMPGGLFNKMRNYNFVDSGYSQPSTIDTMLNNLENQQFNNPMNPRTDDMIPQQTAQFSSSGGENMGGNSSDLIRQVNNSIARMSQIVAKGNEVNRAGFERLFGSSNAAVRGIIDLRDAINKQQYMLQALIENTSNNASFRSNTEATDANTINMIDLLERIAIASEQHLLLDKLKSGVNEHGTIRKSAIRNSLTRFDPYDTGSASKEDIYEQMLEESRKSNQALMEVRDSLTYKAFKGTKTAVKTIAKSPFTAVKGIWKYSTKRVIEEGVTNIKAKMMAKREERENEAIQEYAEAVKNGDEQAKKAAKYKLKRAGISDYITNKLDYGASPSSVALFKDRVSKRNDAATFDKEVRDTIVNGIPLLLSEIVKAINGSDVKYNYGTGSLTDTDTKISTELAMSKERVLDLQNKRSKIGFLRKDNAWNDYKELNEARRNVENIELIQKNQHGKIDLYGNTIKSIHDEHDKKGVKSYKDMAEFFKNTSGSMDLGDVILDKATKGFHKINNIHNGIADWTLAKYKKIKTGQDTYNEFNSIDDISKSPIDIVRLLRNNGVDDDKISAEISEKYGTSRKGSPSLLSSINNIGSNTTDLTVLEDNTTENNVLLKEIIEILNNWRWGRKGGSSITSGGPINPNNNQQQIHTITNQNIPWTILPNITISNKMYNSPIGPNPLNINQYHQPIGPSPLQNNGIKISPLTKISNAYQNLKSSIGDKLQSLNPVTYFKNKFASIKEAKLKKAEEKSYKHIESTDKSIHKIEKMMSKHYRWLRGKAFMSLLGGAISTGLGFLDSVFGGLKNVLGSLGTVLGVIGSAMGLNKLKDLLSKVPGIGGSNIPDLDLQDKPGDKDPNNKNNQNNKTNTGRSNQNNKQPKKFSLSNFIKGLLGTIKRASPLALIAPTAIGNSDLYSNYVDEQTGIKMIKDNLSGKVYTEKEHKEYLRNLESNKNKKVMFTKNGPKYVDEPTLMPEIKKISIPTPTVASTQISANISNIKPSENRIPKVVNTEQQSPRRTFYQLKAEEEKPKKMYYDSTTGIVTYDKPEDKKEEVVKPKIKKESKSDIKKNEPKVKVSTSKNKEAINNVKVRVSDKITKQVKDNNKSTTKQSPAAQAKKVAEKFVDNMNKKEKYGEPKPDFINFDKIDVDFSNKDLTNDKMFIEEKRKIDSLEINNLETRHNMLASLEITMLSQLFNKYKSVKNKKEFMLLANRLASTRYIPENIKERYLLKLNEYGYSINMADIEELGNKANNFKYDWEGNKGKRLEIKFKDKSGEIQKRSIKVFDDFVGMNIEVKKGKIASISTKIDYSDDATFEAALEQIDANKGISAHIKNEQKAMVELQRATVIFKKYKTVDNFKDYNILNNMINNFKYITPEAKNSLFRRLQSMTILDKEMKSLNYVRKNPFKEIQYNKSAKIKELKEVKTYSINGRKIQTKKDFTNNDTFYNTLDSIKSNTKIDETTRKNMLSSVETARVIQKLEKIPEIKSQDQYNEILMEINGLQYANIPELVNILNNKTKLNKLSSSKNGLKQYKKAVKVSDGIETHETNWNLTDDNTFKTVMEKAANYTKIREGFTKQSVKNPNSMGELSRLEKIRFAQLIEGKDKINNISEFIKLMKEIDSFKYINDDVRKYYTIIIRKKTVSGLLEKINNIKSIDKKEDLENLENEILSFNKAGLKNAFNDELFARLYSKVSFDDTIKYGKGLRYTEEANKKANKKSDKLLIDGRDFTNEHDFTDDKVFNAFMTNREANGKTSEQYLLKLYRMAQQFDKDVNNSKSFGDLAKIKEKIDSANWLNKKDKEMFNNEWVKRKDAYANNEIKKSQFEITPELLNKFFRKKSSNIKTKYDGVDRRLSSLDFTEKENWDKFYSEIINKNLTPNSKSVLYYMNMIRYEQYANRKRKITKEESEAVINDIEVSSMFGNDEERRQEYISRIIENTEGTFINGRDNNATSSTFNPSEILDKISNKDGLNIKFKNINGDILRKVAEFRTNNNQNYMNGDKEGRFALSRDDDTIGALMDSNNYETIKDTIGVGDNENFSTSQQAHTLAMAIKLDNAYDLLAKRGLNKEDITTELLSYTADGQTNKINDIIYKIKAKKIANNLGILHPSDNLIKNIMGLQDETGIEWEQLDGNLIAHFSKTSQKAKKIIKEANKIKESYYKKQNEASVIKTDTNGVVSDINLMSAFQAQNKGKIHKATFAEPKNGNEPSAFGSKAQQAVFIEPETGNQTSLGVPNLSEKVSYPWDNNFVAKQIEQKNNPLSMPQISNQSLSSNSNTVTNNIYVLQDGKLHKIDGDTKTTTNVTKSNKPFNPSIVLAAGS